ncbi:centromere protein N-like [Elysia marginata]|uniref:Centromere protein N-like n=1 Tax=Elysia marginata TaxID=1093978 RepID=A0AAV4ESN5_9GAST|nr:centromere protein N-like [Elysia marginata]
MVVFLCSNMSENYINGLIKAVVTRCTADSLREVLKRWGRVGLTQLSGNKAKVCADLQNIAKREQFTMEIAGDLELAYMQLNSSKKFWKVFQLKGANVKHDLDPRSLRLKLVRSLQLKKMDCVVDGNMRMFAGALWFRLHLHSTRRKRGNKQATQAYNHSNSVFLITFPGSPKFMISRAGVQICRLVLQAITEATGAERVVDTNLTGHHVASLADLALHSQPQPDDKFRKMEERENPLAVKINKKRKCTDQSSSFEDISFVVDDTRHLKRQRKEVLSKVYGSGPHPVLEKLEYKFDVSHNISKDNQAHCRAMVEIKGKNVLEGLSKLGREGFIKFPLPKHLASVVSLSQNSFSIKDKT